MRALAIVAVLAAFLCSRPADAALLELHAGLRAGGATGKGIGGAQQDHDFFEGARGGVYGAVVGLEILFIDLWIEHDQLTDFEGLNGTWTQFMAGPHVMFGLSGGPSPKLFGELALSGGFGLGTGQQIAPPLSNGQVSDKGVMVELRVGLEYRLTEILGIGVALPMAWGYMFKNGVPANDTSNHYTTFRAMLVGTLTVRVGL